MESALIFVDRNSWCLFTFCKLGLIFALFSVLSLSPFLPPFLLPFLPSFFPSPFPCTLLSLTLSLPFFSLRSLRTCLFLPGYLHSRSYLFNPFVLTEVEALKNSHIVRSQRLRREKIFTFQNILVHNSSNAVPLTRWKHWIVSMDKRDYIRARVILSPLMAASYLHDFLPARPFWTVLLSRLTWHWFNLESPACSVFALSSYFLLRIDATFSNPCEFF